MQGVQLEDGAENQSKPDASSSEDKSINKKKIKEYIKKIHELVSNSAKDDEVKKLFDKLYKDSSLATTALRMFVTLQGLFGPNIYETFSSRSPWMLYVKFLI